MQDTSSLQKHYCERGLSFNTRLYNSFKEFQHNSEPLTRKEWLKTYHKRPEHYQVLLPYIERLPEDLEGKELQTWCKENFK